MTYRGFGYVVDSCPTNETEFNTAASRLNCSEDEFGRNPYTCVPNEDLSALVEFCYSKIVGLYQKGHCLVETGDGALDHISCKEFITGCPEKNFRGTSLYKFSACSRINTEKRCFYADLSCPNTTKSNTFNTRTTIDFLNTTTNATMKMVTTETSIVDQESSNVGIIIGIITCLLLLLSLMFAFIFWKRRKKPRRYESQNVYKKVTIGRSHIVGEYELWKTPISYQFSTLTDDELSVLFCFLCSDSSPPDFTYSEWLDLLNEIRQGVYRYNVNTVTSVEAQQTLEKLKSRDYLWEGQDKITQDTKDETMYSIASKCDIQFSHISYNTTSVYLRSRGYKRKPDEKCVIGKRSFFNSLLISRLQMNILTHVTMEDTKIFDEVSQFLIIPEEIVQLEETKRKTYLEKLKQTGESVHYSGRSQDNIDHVIWLWRYESDERPDIVRSCIGLHPHRDIYIIDDKAYRKPSTYHSFSPDARCLLYGILLMERYTLDVNENVHKEVLNKIRERYFKDQPSSENIDLSTIPDGITNIQNSTVVFKSDDIRHDVMYSFVTECLMTDSDLEFFLTTASRDVISEYCRSWGYKKSEGERCLYVPHSPEKICILFIEKLQLEIIIHCTMSDGDIHEKISQHLKIPIEVLYWDKDARERFIKLSSQKSINICRARCIIVGCAGAGKTTLVRNLQRTNDNQSPVETTVGLEIDDGLFEIFIDYKRKMDKVNNDGTNISEYLSKQIISMTDLAGQVAYYACHQFYLSRRAVYLVVMDMSKGLDEVVHTQDTDKHKPKGSLFHGWTYKDYFVYWLQTIKTYCDDGKMKEAKTNPLIIIASHHDCVQQKKLKMICAAKTEIVDFYGELEKCLPRKHILKGLISPQRYFEIECPQLILNENQADIIENVRKCIVKTVRGLAHWNENIPFIWSKFEQFIRGNRHKRILRKGEIQNIPEFQSLKENDINDMLRYFKEIGLIIYFIDDGLKENIIVDVQWFVDAFKNIITDPCHAHSVCKSVQEWEIFMKTGRISDSTLVKVWGGKLVASSP